MNKKSKSTTYFCTFLNLKVTNNKYFIPLIKKIIIFLVYAFCGCNKISHTQRNMMKNKFKVKALFKQPKNELKNRKHSRKKPIIHNNSKSRYYEYLKKYEYLSEKEQIILLCSELLVYGYIRELNFNIPKSLAIIIYGNLDGRKFTDTKIIKKWIEATTDRDKPYLPILLLRFYKINIHISRDTFTPVHNAAFFGNSLLLRWLISGKVDINKQNKYGDTPLHDACTNNNINIVKLLIKHNADTKIKNIFGETPLDIAKAKKYLEIIKLLYLFWMRKLSKKYL